MLVIPSLLGKLPTPRLTRLWVCDKIPLVLVLAYCLVSKPISRHALSWKNRHHDEGIPVMQVHRSAVEVVVQVPAKLNLLLEVLARRADGYHEICTLACPIDRFDTLYFKEDPSGKLALECRWAMMVGGPAGAGFETIPCGPENLVLRAVDLLRRRTGVNRGASVRLVKRIPAAAGLGGGSSDAAAALVAANLGWRLGLSPAELADAAAQLGSDVPFFLSGGPAICRGRGEQIEAGRRGWDR